MNEVDVYQIDEAIVSRTEKMLCGFAGEQVVVEFVKGGFYAFGSELATLRLLKKYGMGAKFHQGYSVARGSFYFLLETQYHD